MIRFMGLNESETETGRDWPSEQLANFRTNLRARRETQGLSQSDLAQAVTELGLTMVQPTVHRIESGSRSVRLEEAAAMARALQSSLSELFENPGVTEVLSVLDSAKHFGLEELLREFMFTQLRLSKFADQLERTGDLTEELNGRVTRVLSESSLNVARRVLNDRSAVKLAEDTGRFGEYWLFCQREALSPLPGYRLTAFEHSGLGRVGIAKVDPEADREELEQFGLRPMTENQVVGIISEASEMVNEQLIEDAYQDRLARHRGEDAENPSSTRGAWWGRLLRWLRSEAE